MLPSESVLELPRFLVSYRIWSTYSRLMVSLEGQEWAVVLLVDKKSIVGLLVLPVVMLAEPGLRRRFLVIQTFPSASLATV